MLPPPLRSQPDAAASFYHLAPGHVEGRACAGTACFVARHLNPQCWQRAVDEEPHIHCLGKCYAAPAEFRSSDSDTPPRMEVHASRAIVLGRLVAGGTRTLAGYKRHGGYLALRKALAGPPADVLREMDASGLRGRGGAGFPAGRKWRAVAAQSATEKHVIANADEGDPGAYVDRFLMEGDPHSVIEGMILAGYAVGASHGWIYLRSEYPLAAKTLSAALMEARAEGILGGRVLGHDDFSFDITLHVGRGSYLCGEETALIHSIEGRRPEVTARPPLPTERGLFGLPTLVNNVETLVSVPDIVTHGGAAYHALGFSQSRGTKVVSLNSLFHRPGLYEVEFGVPVRYIVEELGGGLRDGGLKGVIIGGPLAGIVPPHLLDTPLGFEELRAIGAAVGHGGVVAFDERTPIAALVHHVFSFGSRESCGKCTPCRCGSARIEQIFRGVMTSGSAARDQDTEWRDLIEALKWTSLCGHGTGLADFAASVLRYYGKELEPCFQ